ncbi:MAG TPA: polyphosphate kinase 2 family protein, partial [Burkholderiaceae bacterium]
QKQYQELIRATDTDLAPWYVVPSDSKTHRNLAIASIVLETLRAMKLSYPEHPEYQGLRVR